MRVNRIASVLILCLTLAGCRSAYVETTVSNRTPNPITLIEVDYPSASFGTQNLAPGADFHYRFQVIGSGPMKLTYTDNKNQDHSSPGPSLKEGATGPVRIVITPDAVQWQPSPGVKATQP
jgi:hypothetical protein